MQNIEIKCDIFKVSFHESIHTGYLINVAYEGNGYRHEYCTGVASWFVNVSFDYNLIFEV